jgi:hypothetical protein
VGPLDGALDGAIVNKQITGSSEQAVRRRRSVVLALTLAAFAIVLFVTTIVRLGGNVALRDF